MKRGKFVDETRRSFRAPEGHLRKSPERGLDLVRSRSRALLIERQAEHADCGGSRDGVAVEALDLEVVDPEDAFGPDAVASDGLLPFAAALLVVVPSSLFTDKEGAVAGIVLDPGERKGKLEHLRFLEGAGHGIGRAHHAVARMHPDFEELLLRPGIGSRGEAHAEDVVAALPFSGHGKLEIAEAHHCRMHRLGPEVGTPVESGTGQVILVILLPVLPERIVRHVGIVLAFLVETKSSRVGGSGDFVPRSAEEGISFGGLFQFADERDIFRLRRRFGDGGGPALRPLTRVDRVGDVVGHLAVREFALVAHLGESIRRDRTNLAVAADADFRFGDSSGGRGSDLALDPDPVDPDRQFRPDAVGLFTGVEDLPCPQVVVVRALLAEENRSIIPIGVILGELERDLDNLRLFQRSVHRMGAERLSIARVRAELEVTLLRRRLRRVTHPHLHDVIAHRPIIGDEEGEVIIAEVADADGEVGPGLEMRLFQVALMIGPREASAHRGAVAQRAVRLVGVVLHGLESEALGRGSTMDLRPFTAEEILVLGLLPEPGHDRGVLRLRRRRGHRLGPFRGPRERIKGVRVALADAVVVLLGLDVQAARLFGDGMPRKGLLEGLASERLVLLELVRRHEEVRTRRVESARSRVGGQLRDIDLDPEQLTQGVLVLASVEPPHRDEAVLVGEAFPRVDHGVGQIVEKVGFGGIVRLLFFLGRHLPGVHGVEDLLPLLRRLDVGDRVGKLVDAELSLLFFGTMAGEAMLLEEQPVLRGHLRGRNRPFERERHEERER